MRSSNRGPFLAPCSQGIGCVSQTSFPIVLTQTGERDQFEAAAILAKHDERIPKRSAARGPTGSRKHGPFTRLTSGFSLPNYED